MIRLLATISILTLSAFNVERQSPLSNQAMGTTVHVEAVNGEDCLPLVMSIFNSVEFQLSEWDGASPVSELNLNGSIPLSEFPEVSLYALEQSLAVAELTNGAFDPTWAAMWNVWDFKNGIKPSDELIQAKLPLVNWKHVSLTQGDCAFQQEGMAIGFGGIGKGVALDVCKKELDEFGVQDYLIIAGGQVLVRGLKDGKPWKIGIRTPERVAPHAVLHLTDTCVSTSGDYERFFVEDGIRYHHIIDPKTGYPASGTKSVTVVTNNATLADALSTALFVIGPLEAMKLVNEQEGVEAYIIDSEDRVHMSCGMESLIAY